MKSALRHALAAALDSMLESHPSAEDAFVPLSDVMRLAALAKVDARLMCSIRPSDDTLVLMLTTSDPAPVLALHDLGTVEQGALGHLLAERRQVAEATWEYKESISRVETVFFVRLEAGGRHRDLDINWQASLILTLGWREDFRPDEAAEALVHGEDLAKALADLVGIEGRW